MKAIGIPCISDDVVDVKTKEIAECLSLKKEDIYRGKGPVDLLIGINHARLHTGETRQAGKSPLGWVVFGETSQDAYEKSQILRMKYTTPVDLSDFWTMETMGVAVTLVSALQTNLVRSRGGEGHRKFLSESWKPMEARKKLEATERDL